MLFLYVNEMTESQLLEIFGCRGFKVNEIDFG